ncbi:hypothetical protein BMW22_26295 (plasmid) [Rhizobium leguminosarum]|uniref:Uncharacterized protein n=1 Tax=Rhizobium leguminosarum TaxID=384 RepID=A0A1B1CPD7_RHILE|nr:hypothetical protein BA011_36760 [Rhizobium leguminosarum]API55128.1 hypothetical protein BMW22_26295 [Rhizobium leguminosarum]
MQCGPLPSRPIGARFYSTPAPIFLHAAGYWSRAIEITLVFQSIEEMTLKIGNKRSLPAI